MVDRAQHRELNARLIALGVWGCCPAWALSGWPATRPFRGEDPEPSGRPAGRLVVARLRTALLAGTRRTNRLGPVMVLTGFAWFASVLQEGNGAVVSTIGMAFPVLYLAGFLYLVLSFPSGRLQTALDRALVVGAFGLVTVVQLAWLLVADPRPGCARCAGRTCSKSTAMMVWRLGWCSSSGSPAWR